jgi:uncharacterized protein YecE (DUF72 family)
MLGRMAARKPASGRRLIRVGVGGWSFAPWRGLFYPRGLPQKSELAHMSSQLNSLEINSTFYGLQKPATFQRWHDGTPADFVFSVKAPMFVVGRRDLATASASIDRFLDSGVLRLGGKLGPFNWQLGPAKPFNAAEIEAFLSLLPGEREGCRLRHAIEVRHPSFAVPEFVNLAREHQVAIVMAGDSEYPRIADATAPFAYLRIMGTKDAEPRGYPPAALTHWARIARAIAEGSAVKGLSPVVKGTKVAARDVFLYVISGAKRRNPAAARALLEKLR